MKIKVAIFRNESQIDHITWVEACERNPEMVEYEIIDITRSDWYDRFSEIKFDLILLRPPGRTEKYKQLFDERAMILNQYSGKQIYPSINEILIYENKRFLRDWLKANEVPHPDTQVFFSKKEAVEFTYNWSSFPIVAKTNIGGSGNGVVFLRNSTHTIEYIDKAFNKGIKTRTGPKLNKGSLFKKLVKVIFDKRFFLRRLTEYKETYINPQKDFVIFQKFIPHEYEWRCVRIGDSYFAHKKISKNNKSSGTLIKDYSSVPLALLDFIKDLTNRTKLTSVAIDLFDYKGQYLVNEIQCFFGQSDPYQMLIDSKPGRYRFISGEWKFEEGDFASHECYDLRLEHALSLIKVSIK